MKTPTVLSLLTTLLTSTTLAMPANPTTSPPLPPICGTCNPLSGQNSCDPTTSCINTGSAFHCACRAGYKASTKNDDITQQFRLNVPGYQWLVFTPENTVCDTLCDDPFGPLEGVCAEVPIYYASKGCRI